MRLIAVAALTSVVLAGCTTSVPQSTGPALTGPALTAPVPSVPGEGTPGATEAPRSGTPAGTEVATATPEAPSATSGPATSGPATALHDTIAYVRASTGDEIRVIRPDGTDDRSLWSHGLDDPSAVYEVWSLAWSPDSSELAFASTHEDWCSINSSDLFVIAADGTSSRRVTQAPACAELAAYPQGTVRFPVDYPGLLGDSFTGFVYLQGAPTLQSVSLPPGGSGEVVFESVADFGDGILQTPSVVTGAGRDFAIGSAVDVLPGGSVTAPDLTLFQPTVFWEARSPTWRQDGSMLGYAYGFNSLSGIVPRPSPVDFGTSLVGADAVVANLILHLAWGPTPESADRLLYQGTEAGTSEGIYLTSQGATAAGDELLTFDAWDIVKGLAWMQDASGFVFSVTDQDILDAPQSNVYHYAFADGQTTRVTDLTGEFAGLLSVSVDGRSLVFERAAAEDGLGSLVDPELWIVGLDGAGLRLLAEDAMAPAWSR
jgi:hypothetical protein